MDERKQKYLNSDKGTEYSRCREYKRWTPEDDKLILTDAEGVHDRPIRGGCYVLVLRV